MVSAFTILEFLLVMLLTGMTISGSMYLLKFWNLKTERHIQYNDVLADIVAFNNLLQKDIDQATYLFLDDYGNLIMTNENHEKLCQYEFKLTEDLLRNGISMERKYGINLQEVQSFFESSRKIKTSLVDRLIVKFKDQYQKDHSVSFIKSHDKATLYNYFWENRH